MSDWMARAACRGEDRELFFAESRRAQQAAKTVCRRCPVVGECDAYALEAGEAYGVWGGRTEDERREVLRTIGHRAARRRSPVTDRHHRRAA